MFVTRLIFEIAVVTNVAMVVILFVGLNILYCGFHTTTVYLSMLNKNITC